MYSYYYPSNVGTSYLIGAFNPSEEYESISWDDSSQYMWVSINRGTQNRWFIKENPRFRGAPISGNHQMFQGTRKSGAFLKWGYQTTSSIYFNGIFPYKPSRPGGVPKPPMDRSLRRPAATWPLRPLRPLSHPPSPGRSLRWRGSAWMCIPLSGVSCKDNLYNLTYKWGYS